ncbi:hypothetical protein D5E69_14950 [Rossellomorea marisflavi]|uniref:hypothetical protein n=1 Tax=Rossellomorea marisflavi TaxID=189381 RepID=UPI0013166B12|nr:hypothetical protein [Rossellomorea marisflavi]QHA38519.1 hypothetical protein D5E69_14950 [Rossellomorea marisflavi]
MKRFGIDIDGTVTSPASLLPHINDHFKLALTLDDITQYELTEVLNISPAEFGAWFKDAEPIIYKDSPLADGAKEVLDLWKESHELFFISARRSDLLQVTKNWFSECDLTYHHIELIGSHDKVSTAKKYDVDLFFEDKHDNAVAIHEALKIPVLLFNTPYNQDPIPEGVIRVNDWEEAAAWVKNWLK